MLPKPESLGVGPGPFRPHPGSSWSRRPLRSNSPNGGS